MTTWQSVYSEAKNAGAKFPEVVCAQWALESGYGQHLSGKNNFFGIKGSPGTKVQTQEWSNGSFITIEAEFKDFDSSYDCVEYLVDRWYEDFDGYKGVNRAETAEECAELLKVEGYATDPAYVEKLLGLMDANPMPQEAPEAPSKPLEVSMDTTPPQEASEPLLGNAVDLRSFFSYYSDAPWQRQAVDILIADLKENYPQVLGDRHPWIRKFRRQPLVDMPAIDSDRLCLEVPYLYQLDSEVSGQGGRMCWSSTNAMLVEYLLPGSLTGSQADDIYLDKVLDYGDTTSSAAQVSALKSYGLDANFEVNGTAAKVKASLRRNVPMPIGVLHYGPAHECYGHGHWLLIVGFDDAKGVWICHDPYGELDCANGGYLSNAPTAGKFVEYSYQNLNPRWMVEGSGTGWYISVSD
ncbi:hypothetical protein PSS2_gp098 [Cyanophage PSS2]|uniref:hypothetical protein n=1 Tax=Cyanophage PSS2 TaxID=658401 RepID=UPI0001B04039|nr:hypothetical protein PSS2_gp098 [Cyanophage PSS2]ACT65660.1 hypothetical protein [Cyanophage PSS2]